MAMSQLDTPIVCVVIGEGGSGGALGIGIGDRLAMLEHAYYSVISPEGCATILWKASEHAPKAAEALKMTSRDLLRFGIIDEIIPEPLGGAHRDHREAAAEPQVLPDPRPPRDRRPARATSCSSAATRSSAAWASSSRGAMASTVKPSHPSEPGPRSASEDSESSAHATGSVPRRDCLVGVQKLLRHSPNALCCPAGNAPFGRMANQANAEVIFGCRLRRLAIITYPIG